MNSDSFKSDAKVIDRLCQDRIVEQIFTYEKQVFSILVIVIYGPR